MPRRRPTPLSVRVSTPSAEPDLTPEHKQAILVALRWAWGELCRSQPMTLREGGEEAVTILIERLLNERAEGQRRARWIEDFDAVTRGSKVVTADGRIEKAPDLHFRPPPYRDVRHLSDWAWFVESKLIDGDASVEAYCAQGVQRFSSGEYGARMPTGGMVGYVRDGQQPFEALDRKLAGRFAILSHERASGPDVSRSRHRRSGLPEPCVDMELTHLWLQVE